MEGVHARLAQTEDDGHRIAESGEIPVFVDPEAKIIRSLKPDVVDLKHGLFKFLKNL